MAENVKTEPRFTTLSLRLTTRGRLAKFGDTAMTWDSVLNALMDHADKTGYKVE